MGKRCLLIVDDEEDITTPILRKAILEYADKYEPIIAIDGFDALDTMKMRDVAVVILDIRMKNLDGWGVIAKAKADPQLKNIPIVVSSGHLNDDEKEKLHQMGICEILDKPYFIKQLFEVILRADKTLQK